MIIPMELFVRVFITALAAAACVATTAGCAIFGGGIISKQARLYNSIKLVELKCNKIGYWLAVPFFGLLAVNLFNELVNASGREMTYLRENFHMGAAESRVVLSSLFVMLMSVVFLMVVLALSKSALVDRGVYTAVKYLDWYHVYDYLIDEDKSAVILTSSKRGPLSLRGTTPPLKFDKKDVDKLEFILNKNKNKFLSGFELR